MQDEKKTSEGSGDIATEKDPVTELFFELLAELRY